MTGLWMILLLAYTQPDELLPAPKNELLPKPLLVSSSAEFQQLPEAAPECRIGWGTDPADESMYMVIQLAPEAIAHFAADGKSMELESLIPKGLQGRLQKVIIRVGTGPVEQSPPESELDRLPALSTNRSVPGAAVIANLDRRSPVSIDTPRSSERSMSEIVPTSGTTQLPVVPGLSLPAAPSPVSANAPTVLSTPIPNQTVPASAPLAGQTSTAVSSPYNAPSTNTYGSDGFAPMPRTVPSTLNPFAKSGLASTTTTTSQGNVTYSSSTPAAPQGVYPNNSGYQSVPHLASNPNAPQGGYVLPTDSYASYGQPQNGHVQHGYAQSNYGQNGYASQGANNHLPSNPVLPISQAGARPLPSTVTPPVLTLPTTQQRELELANTTPKGTLVPFFLVLSFILNVYFGLWLNHLSTKYRHLLGSVRGLTPTTIEG